MIEDWRDLFRLDLSFLSSVVLLEAFLVYQLHGLWRSLCLSFPIGVMECGSFTVWFQQHGFGTGVMLMVLFAFLIGSVFVFMAAGVLSHLVYPLLKKLYLVLSDR